MKSLWIIFLLFASVNTASAHNYYFGFAEMQYNETNQTLETTVVLSAHDLEDILLKNGSITTSLEYLTSDASAIAAVAKEVLKGFELKIGNKSIAFECLGFDITKNGMINVYLLGKDITLGKELNITFACLMDVFPEQQNKITFIKDSKKYTAVFLPHQKSAVISIQ